MTPGETSWALLGLGQRGVRVEHKGRWQEAVLRALPLPSQLPNMTPPYLISSPLRLFSITIMMQERPDVICSSGTKGWLEKSRAKRT